MAPETIEHALRITWVKSGIGYSVTQKRTLRALGFRRLGEVMVKEDSPSLRGMILAVNHLLEVEEVSK